MATHDPLTVLLQSDLGPVENYDPTALARVVAKDSLLAGRVYLRLTLREMIRIRTLSPNLGEDHHDLLRDTRARYDDLLRQQNELESFKRQWIYKLLKYKPKSIKRVSRAFANDAFELWDSTASTSDKMQRALLSTLSTDLASVEGKFVAKDEQVSGLAVDVDGPVTQDAMDIIREGLAILASINPLSNPTPPDSQDGQTSTADTTLVAESSSSARSSISASLNSPGSSFNLSLNLNVVNNIDSVVPGLTMSNGTGNSGSVTDYSSSVNSPPS